MQFCSLSFIIAFAIFFWLYWIIAKSKTFQNLMLLVASYAFYAMYDWRCSFLLLLTSLSVYVAGEKIGKLQCNSNGGRSSKMILVLTIAFNLLILGYFKYCNFFIQGFGDLTGNSYTTLDIILPVGISFYTFSSISYVVDVYQRKLSAEHDVISVLTYVSFFPAILSGPIHKATEQLPQYLKKREFDEEYITRGFRNFLWGAFMKLCIADRLSMYVDAVYGNIPQHNGTTLALASICYTLQIYADFAGYSLMAIGCGKMLGIHLQTNFVRPYFSKTITEFWSKWHISLTSWFRNYVYFPLGGNRCSKPRWVANIMIVFLLSGLWHGAAYTFILWGALHGLAQIIEKLVYKERLKSLSDSNLIINALRVLVTFSIVSVAWIFFRIPNIHDAGIIVSRIFSEFGTPFIDIHTFFFVAISLPILIVKDVCDQWFPMVKLLESPNASVRLVTCLILVAFILLFGKLDSQSFIYFQF